MIYKNNNEKEQSFWMALLALLGLLALGLWFYSLLQKKNKSEVAKGYGVSKYVLSKWIKSYCSEKISIKYVGNRIQKIRLIDIRSTLGYPFFCPQYLKNGKLNSIINKSDLERAFDISRSTLDRAINKIENPIGTIGIHISTYKSSSTFPPSIMNKICKYLYSIGCYGKKPKYQNTRQIIDLFAKRVNYAEFADIK